MASRRWRRRESRRSEYHRSGRQGRRSNRSPARLSLWRTHHLTAAGRAVGLAHAVLTASPSAATARSMYSGQLLEGRDAICVAAFREHEPDALILLTRCRPENYGVAELAPAPAGETGQVRAAWWRRPKQAGDRPGAGRRVNVTGQIPRAGARDRTERAGELEITDAIQPTSSTREHAVERTSCAAVQRTPGLEDMREANRLILDNQVERLDGELVDSRVDGDAWGSRRARGGAKDRERPASSAPAFDARLTNDTSARTRRSASAARSPPRRSSTRSCWPDARSPTSSGRMECRVWGET